MEMNSLKKNFLAARWRHSVCPKEGLKLNTSLGGILEESRTRVGPPPSQHQAQSRSSVNVYGRINEDRREGRRRGGRKISLKDLRGMFC